MIKGYIKADHLSCCTRTSKRSSIQDIRDILPGQATILVGWLYVYCEPSILGGLVTHTKSIQFQIFIEKYLNSQKLMNRIFEYIRL